MTSPHQPNQPYGHPGQPYNVGPAGQPYGMYSPRQEEPKSPALGILGLALVVVASLAMLVMTYYFGTAFTDVSVELGRRGLDTNSVQQDPRFRQFIIDVMGQASILSFVSIGWLAGWIISIVAVSLRRGRTYGIWGIVLGVLAPIIAGALLMGIGMLAASRLGG